jgi:hypothetical protein
VLIMKETLWKNNLNFEKLILITYINFIVIVITVSKKKRKRFFVQTLVLECYLKQLTVGTSSEISTTFC